MPPMNSTTRLLFSLFVAALCTPIIILFWQVIRTGINLDHGYLDVFRSTFGGFMVYGIASEGTAFILGLPTFLLFRRLHLGSWPLYALGGAVVSLMASVALTLTGTLYFFTGQPSKVHAWADSIPLFVVCGMTSALIFWALVRPEPVQ
jgi:hypothetical protein